MEYTENKDGNNYTYAFSGKFTFADHASFRNILNSIRSDGVKQIALELSGVEFVDSAALGMFLVAREECEKNNVSLVLQSPSGQLEKMFRVSKFDTLFTIK